LVKEERKMSDVRMAGLERRVRELAEKLEELSRLESNRQRCRDLILPCVYLLAQFLESVKIEEKDTTV